MVRNVMKSGWGRLSMAALGALIYAVGINLFVVPLGLITGVLGFDGDGTALMLAIFALQDSFGTACNVTGDGALTLMLTGYAEKHHIRAENVQNVEL